MTPTLAEISKRHYDPMTDRVVPDAPAGYTPWPDVRHQALLAAIEAAKLGLAHDIYATAGRYARWLAGGEEEAAPVLPFAERLRDLVDECVKSGEVDHELVLHHMQVVMGIPEAPPPREPPYIPINGEQP